MKKEKLIEALKKGQIAEEAAIPLYTKHIKSSLFLSDFDEKSQERIAEILEQLKTESEHHAMLFDDLIKKVQQGDKDVY